MSDDLSPSEVARRLGTSTRTVQRWITGGTLPARRVGGRWRVASDAFDAFRASADASTTRAAPGARLRTLFIANRGEIAARIARTCDALGIRAVVPQTDGPARLDLLDVAAVTAAAVGAGADAVHPGFGFLAENPAFAESVLAAGLRWIGPPPAAIRLMGDKGAARGLARELGIPVPAGYDGADQRDMTLVAAAREIGLPLLIKPAAGGGGKGMHTVRDEARLAEDLAAARREATAAFGDPRLILERRIEGARHVEVQVLFDRHGSGVHLGERDCSLQRRNQKVLEETPAPSIDRAVRAQLTEAALALARAVRYESAGTCEFLVDDRGSVTFLEMNTRLQVEHPVTELVTGRDLVADQLAIAEGAPLPITQEDIQPAGHAIEVRLYAEDAEDGFLPATGRIGRLRWPSGPGIRVDAGVEEGDEVTSRFDPMLAKVIAHGRDRDEALERLTAALDATVVLGVTTNLRFLRWVVREPAVRQAAIRIDTLERIWPPDDWAERAAVPDDAWRAAAAALVTGGARGDDPWRGGWRLNAPAAVTLETEGRRRITTIEPDATGPAAPDFQGAAAVVVAGDTAHIDVGGRSIPIRVAPPPDVDRAARAAARDSVGTRMDLVAPMPGRIVTIDAGPGAAVSAGDAVVTLEAMKMEHRVVAPWSGHVQDVVVAVGDQVERGQLLAVVEP